MKSSVSLLTLAAALLFAAPAFAADAATTASAAAPNADMMAKRMAIHQEMQTLHKEGLEIEASVDALLDKCIAPEASQVDACKTEKQQLVQRRADHKKKIEELRTQMEAAGPMMGPHRGMQMQPNSSTTTTK